VNTHYTRPLEPGAHGLQKWPEYTRHSDNVNTLTFHFSPQNFMKYATFSLASDAVPRLGVVRGDRMLDPASLSAGNWRPPTSLVDLIQQGPASWQRMRELVGQVDPGTGHRLDDVRWHPPIPRPIKNVYCLGRNYVAHAEEAARARGQEVKIPTVPVIFTKASTSVIGPVDDIPVDRAVTQQVDWEVELGAVIGKTGRNISRGDALQHVFGYTVINDVSARDLQQQHMQWFKGKSLDGFCPMGPLIVTADEFGDPQSKHLQLRVNGFVKQDASTAKMIFAVDAIIEWLSKGLTLEAGDIIATGTPEGVGMGRTPQEFLVDGDVVEAEVEGIGTLRNRIRDC
jgi:2-keto-4-pentenoate hydratase/2-oxohepta-3-ene-1,7-dioic acid hydratase in catechol pathway